MTTKNTTPIQNSSSEMLTRKNTQRAYLASLSDEELRHHATESLRKSFENRGTIYHEDHHYVDLIWAECVQRDNTLLFDEAFEGM